MIRFSVLGVFCLLALASSAHADAPFGGSLKNEVVPVFRWTGFYVGINGGYGWAADPGDIHYESSLDRAGRTLPAGSAAARLVTTGRDRSARTWWSA
jgi:hypothetical protein